MYLTITLLTLAILWWVLDRFWLRGAPQPEFEEPDDPEIRQRFDTQPEFEAPLHAVNKTVREMSQAMAKKILAKDIQGAREIYDSLGDGRTYTSSFSPADADGVEAEWVMSPDGDPKRRLLYIHGGAFKLGSPKSHRIHTNNFAELTGCAVLSINYRMLPEHRFKDAVDDCRTAYKWLLANGPDGQSAAEHIFVAGDSAGGNLSLSLIAWLRDQNIRQPDAVVAMSPLTDGTLSGASVRNNESSDIMLNRLIAPINRIPNAFRPWVIAIVNRARPANHVVSPLHGNLAKLPPTLLQASEAEMLLDDSRRYFSKARAAGSPVKLQTWADVVHVWQMYDPQLPQARQAWLEISKFIAEHSIQRPDTNDSE